MRWDGAGIPCSSWRAYGEPPGVFGATLGDRGGRKVKMSFLRGLRKSHGSLRGPPGDLLGCLEPNPKPLLSGSKYIIKTQVLRLGRFWMEWRDCQDSIFFLRFSGTSPVLDREVNSLEKLMQVGPLSKMKKKYSQTVEFGRWILGSQNYRNHTKANRNRRISILTCCVDFEQSAKYVAFAGKWKSEY